jgi:hypothetical protein
MSGLAVRDSTSSMYIVKYPVFLEPVGVRTMMPVYSFADSFQLGIMGIIW